MVIILTTMATPTFSNLMIRLLPSVLQKNIIKALFKTFGYELDRLKTSYKTSYDNIIYVATHTGQVAVLHNVLNAQFGYTRENGFTIGYVTIHDFNYIYSEQSALLDTTIKAISEQQTTQPPIIYDESSIATEAYPYILYVPSGVWNNSNSMNQLNKTLKTYRLPGRVCILRLKTE